MPSFSSRYFNKIKRTSRLGKLLAVSLEILCIYNLEPNLIYIASPKGNGECHKTSDMTTNYSILVIQTLPMQAKWGMSQWKICSFNMVSFFLWLDYEAMQYNRNKSYVDTLDARNFLDLKVIIPTFFICIYYRAKSILETIWPLILLKLLQLAHDLIVLTCNRGSPLITWILQEEFLRQHYRRCSYQVKQVNYSQCIMFGLIYF